MQPVFMERKLLHSFRIKRNGNNDYRTGCGSLSFRISIKDDERRILNKMCGESDFFGIIESNNKENIPCRDKEENTK